MQLLNELQKEHEHDVLVEQQFKSSIQLLAEEKGMTVEQFMAGQESTMSEAMSVDDFLAELRLR
jgi:tRNA A-37 threonylcarbamoyl transferase component Bud32